MAVHQVHLRLVDQVELVVVQGAPQLGLHQQPVLLPLGQVLGEGLPAVATAMLAVVHGGVGVLDQLLRIVAIAGGVGDADAGAEVELVFAEPEWQRQRVQDRVGQARGQFVVGAVAQHQEFVTAEARQQALGADGLGDALAGAHQQVVAGAVAEHVVDGLETVQVDVQHRHPGLGRVMQARVQFGQDRVAVEDAGERVGARLHPQGFLGLLALGDVLQGAGHPWCRQQPGFGLADHADPEPVAIATLAGQFQVEAGALLDHPLHRLGQAPAIVVAQPRQQRFHRLRARLQADDAQRLAGQVQVLAGTVPLPAADMGQRLGAVEQGVVALEFGDVAEQQEHMVGLVAATGEHRHRGGRDPQHPLAAGVVQADGGTGYDVAIAQGALDRPLLLGHRLAAFVHDRPFVDMGQQVHAQAGAEDAVRGRIGRQQAVLAVDQQHALVDGLHQQAVARLGLPAATEVARHRHDALVAGVGEPGRMHLHREAAAVAAHVGHFDDVGFAPVEGFPHRFEVVRRQVRIEGLDRLADDLLAGAVVGADAGLVEVQHDAGFAEDADRVGHRVEQGVVAQARGFTLGQGLVQRVAGLHQQRTGRLVQRVDGQGGLKCGQRGLRVHGGNRFDRVRAAAVHAGASARPTLLPVWRPNFPASQRPVAASASRSMPVSMPMPCSIYTRSSLATLPLAPRA